MKLELGFEGAFPQRYTCDGEDVSPEIVFSDVPAEAETKVLIVDDPDAPGSTFTHWIIWNIDPEQNLKEGVPQQESYKGATQGTNDFGEIGYRGPCPPSGTHNYRFRAYALDTELDLRTGINVQQLEEAMEGHVLDQATVERDYSE